MSPNPCGIIYTFQMQLAPKCYQKVRKYPLPIKGYNIKHFQSVVTLDIAPQLVFQKPRLSYFLPFVERTVIGLLYPFGNILYVEVRVWLVDWTSVSCTS